MIRISPRNKRCLSGVTLIELLIYASLVTVIVGTFLTGSYYLISSSQHDRERLAVLDNERFILQKIEAELLGVSANQITPVTGSAPVLTIQRTCATAVRIDQSGTAVRLTRNTDGDCDADDSDQNALLTDSHITVSGLQFSVVTSNAQKAIRIQSTLTGRYNVRTIDKTVYLK